MQIFKIFLAGLLTFLLCRNMGLSQAGSLLSGIAFAFGGGLVTSFRNMEANTYIFLPLFFHGFVLYRPNSPLSMVVRFAPAAALLIFAGHPGATFYAFIGGVVYLCVERDPRKMGLGILSLVLGACLSCIVLIPFVEYFFSSALTYHSFEPQEGFTLHLFLTRMTAFFVPLPLEHFPLPYMAYCGVIPLAFAILNMWGRKRSFPLIGVLLFGIFIFLRLPPLSWLGDLPFFRQSRPIYAIGLVSFSLSLMAGMGFDEWGRRRKKTGVLLIKIGLLILVLSLFLSLLSRFGIMTYAPEMRAIEWVRVIALRVLLAGVFSLSIVLLGGWNGKREIASRGAVVLAILDLFLAGFRYNRPTDSFNFPETAPIRWLKAQPGLFRVLGMEGSNNIPNTGLAHAIPDLRINDPMLQSRYLRTMMAIDPSGILEVGPIPRKYSSGLLDILNVRYLIACTCRVAGTDNEYDDPILKHQWHSLPVPGSRWQVTYRDRDTLIYENTHVFPRAFVLHDIRLTAEESESYSALRAKDINLRKTAILEVPDPRVRAEIEMALSEKRSGKKSTTKIILYSPHKIKLTATLPATGVLVLGDAYDRNWKVLVDGQEATVYPADYLLRGVIVKGGRHEVEFYYDPWSFRVGALISGISLVLMGVLFAHW